ncbi:MAG: cbb3-type cytochrome c oxidase subunit 3 [Chlorobiaceae bacterium]|jgi:cbb3-type cytochrome oxidase subunit 3
MSFSGLAYVLFTILLAIISGGIIAYYYNPKRKQNIEAPKHRMLDDDN